MIVIGIGLFWGLGRIISLVGLFIVLVFLIIGDVVFGEVVFVFGVMLCGFVLMLGLVFIFGL